MIRNSFLTGAALTLALIPTPAIGTKAQQQSREQRRELAQQRSCENLAQSLVGQRNRQGSLSYEIEASHYDAARKTCFVMAKISDSKAPASDAISQTEVILNAADGTKVAILTTNPKGKSVCWVKDRLGQGADQFNQLSRELGLLQAKD